MPKEYDFRPYTTTNNPSSFLRERREQLVENNNKITNAIKDGNKDLQRHHRSLFEVPFEAGIFKSAKEMSDTNQSTKKNAELKLKSFHITYHEGNAGDETKLASEVNIVLNCYDSKGSYRPITVVFDENALNNFRPDQQCFGNDIWFNTCVHFLEFKEMITHLHKQLYTEDNHPVSRIITNFDDSSF